MNTELNYPQQGFVPKGQFAVKAENLKSANFPSQVENLKNFTLILYKSQIERIR